MTTCACLQGPIPSWSLSSVVSIFRQWKYRQYLLALILSVTLLVAIVTIACVVAVVQKNASISQEDGERQRLDGPSCNDDCIACSVPQRRTVIVRDVFMESYKRYTPRVTVLHRCTSETGCCKNFGEECGPKETVNVTLTFLVQEGSTSYYEDLCLVNHTVCGCTSMDKTRTADSCT